MRKNRTVSQHGRKVTVVAIGPRVGYTVIAID